MLPRSEWQTKTTALVKTEEEKEEGKTEAPEIEWKKDTDNVMPTGNAIYMHRTSGWVMIE